MLDHVVGTLTLFFSASAVCLLARTDHLVSSKHSHGKHFCFCSNMHVIKYLTENKVYV